MNDNQPTHDPVAEIATVCMARVAAVKALHVATERDGDPPWCDECDQEWPCPTYRAATEG